MMHPFANVAGLFEDPLPELGGPVRRPHRVARVLRDRREARLRPRRPLGPGPDRRPDQHRAAEPGRRADLGRGPPPARPAHLGHGANWGLFAEDLPDEANHITLSSTVTDSSGHPGARGPLPDVGQLAPDARLPHRAGDGIDGCRRRLQDRGRPTDALLRLAPAGHGADGRRPGHLRARPLEPQLTTSRTSTSSTARASSPRPASTRPRRSSPSRCAPPTTWSRPASSSRCRCDDGRSGPDRRPDRPDRRDAGDRRRPAPPRPAVELTDEERATLRAIADHLIPAAHGMPSAGGGPDRRAPPVRASGPTGPGRAAPGRAPAGPRRRRRRPPRAPWPTIRPTLSALQLAIVGGYYTDPSVKERIGYPGQVALELRSWEVPDLSRRRPHRRRARARTGVARPRDRPAGRRHRCAATVRRALGDRSRVARRRTRWPRSPLIPRSRPRRAGSRRSWPTGDPARARRSRIANPPPVG